MPHSVILFHLLVVVSGVASVAAPIKPILPTPSIVYPTSGPRRQGPLVPIHWSVTNPEREILWGETNDEQETSVVAVLSQ